MSSATILREFWDTYYSNVFLSLEEAVIESAKLTDARLGLDEGTTAGLLKRYAKFRRFFL